MEMGRNLCLAVIYYNDYKNGKIFSIKSNYKTIEFTSEKLKNELINEIEEKKAILKTFNSTNKNNSDSESDESDDSDSEPSVDNFEIEEISKLVPQTSEMQKKIKKISKIKFLSIAKSHNKSLIFDKLIPKEISDTCLNENLEKKITEVRKTENFPLIKINTRNLTLFDIEKQKTPIDINKTRKFLNINFLSGNKLPKEEKILIQIKNKKNADTQTEDIFFTKPWTYFQALNYVVLENNNYIHSKRFHKIENTTRIKFSKSPELRIKSFDQFKTLRDSTKAIQSEHKTHLNIHSNKIEFIVKSKTNLGQLSSNHFLSPHFLSKR